MAAAQEPCHVTVTVLLEAAVRRDRSAITCFRCGETGHYRAECHAYRTRLCTRRGCDDANCFFAHGQAELRRPWLSKCVRVDKAGSTICIRGCGQVGHTYRNCPQSVDTRRTVSELSTTLRSS